MAELLRSIFGPEGYSQRFPQVPDNGQDGESFGVQQYIESGGMWDEEAFYWLRGLLEEDPKPVNKTLIEQAKNMGGNSQQAYLYAVPCEEYIGKRLSQQALMAEVMLVMGDMDKREAFMRENPHINFGNNQMQKQKPRLPEEVRKINFRSTETVLYTSSR